jgi:tRNA-Thr(GGU) m(6)t(6)A37 methyltransferase TsaA
MKMNLAPIGVIHSPHQRAEGTPVQAALAAGGRGTVEVFPEYAAGLRDLDGFERVWLVYWFDRAKPAELVVTLYLDTTPRELFATRAPCRPNPIGLSAVRLLGIVGGSRSASPASTAEDNTPAAVDLRKLLREMFVNIFILLRLMTRVHVNLCCNSQRGAPAPGSLSNQASETP